jgi:peptide deformylase
MIGSINVNPTLVSSRNPILYSRAQRLDPGLTSDFHSLVEKVQSIMFGNNGIGLAAPQIGIPYRFFIMGIEII